MTQVAAPTIPEPPESLFAGASKASWWALTVLMIVGLYMFADRHVISLQTEPMRAALGLSDLQIGLVQGLSVALFAAVAGYPIAWLADRFDVRFILSASVLLWCAAVAACGLARNFEELFIASAIVGAGEAGLTPITYAIIPELFKGRARLLANAMVMMIGRVASGGVIILSGLLVQYVGGMRPWLPIHFQDFEAWRLALLVLALPGPLLALAVLSLRLRTKPTVVASVAPGAEGQGSARVWPFLSSQVATIAPLYFGVGMLIFGMSALGAFLPVVAIREMGASPAAVGGGIGGATLISTLVALVIVVGFAGRMLSRFGPRFTLWLLAAAALGPAIIAPAFLLIDTPLQMYILLGLCFVFLSTGAMAFPTALQDLTPRSSRARLIAIAILLNIILSALAPVAVGGLSDQLGGRPNGLMQATVAIGTLALLLSGGLIMLATFRYGATIAAAREEDARVEGVAA